MAEEDPKEPQPVDPEKLLAELEARRLAARDAARGNPSRYRNLIIALLILGVLAMAALWLLMRVIEQLPRPGAEAGNSHLPSSGQPPKIPVFRWDNSPIHEHATAITFATGFMKHAG